MRRKEFSEIMLLLILIGMSTPALGALSADTKQFILSEPNGNLTAGLDVLSVSQGNVQRRDASDKLGLKDSGLAPTDYSSEFGNERMSLNSLSEQGVKTSRSHFAPNQKWDFSKASEWGDFAYVDEDSVRLVIGLSNDSQNSSKLSDCLAGNGVKLVNSVSMSGRTEALVADVPFSTLHSFVSRIETTGFVSYIQPNMRYEIDSVPNDPKWSEQWSLAKIEADCAWNTTTGDFSVLVAVVDTGVDWTHPDLAANYVPLGYDWVNQDADPLDDHGHGTHVAGTIAAVTNNNRGVAGIAQVRIMAEKGIAANGSGWNDVLAEAILHAVDQGANIISCSWGGYAIDPLLHQALRYAYDHGVLIVAAAGNEATSTKHYPSAYDEVIAVAATDDHDDPAFFSNFGDWIDVAAPGVEILSTVLNNSYANMSGTSMACPHVSGLGALIWSRFPNMTRDQVEAQLQYTAEDFGDPSFDIHYGFGRINARKAVEQAPPSHDLLILNWQTPPYARPGDMLTVNLTVLNMGENGESDIVVRLLVNGSLVRSEDVGSLASGASISISYLWNPIVAGAYNLTLYVVPVLGEVATHNNALSRRIWVRSAIIIEVPQDYMNIQDAIDAAIDGDTVSVRAGTYYEHLRVYKSLIITGENKSTTIVDGNNSGTVVRLDSNRVSVSGITVQDGDFGISISGSDYNTISDNIIESNYAVGIYMSFSSCNVISGNTIVDNGEFGIEFDNANSNTLRGNSLIGNLYSLTFSGDDLSNYIQDIDVSNTVNGKPIYYWVNQEHKQVPLDAGYVAVVNSRDILVKDLELANNGKGILFFSTTDSTIRDNDITNNYDGIVIHSSHNNTIEDNRVQANARGGIWIVKADPGDNSIFGNNIIENYSGVALQNARGNGIADNVITKNVRGILIVRSSNNTFSGNLVTQGSIGVDLWWSNENVIYHNDLIDNTWQVQARDSICTWDESYPSGGNYWSDYAGTDEKKGPTQDQSGSDAVGDTPYIIDTDNRDRYPLWHPWSLPPYEHELMVFLEAPGILVPGYSLLLNATAINKGLSNETNVELMLLINNSIVESRTIHFLQAGRSHTINYLWAPTVVGEYNITTYAPPLSGEERVTNNIAAKTVSVFGGTIMYLAPFENTAVINETFTINIKVAAVKDLDSWQARLYFDPTVLNLTGVRLPADHIFNDRPFVFPDPVEKTDAIGAYVQFGVVTLGPMPGFTGSGTLGQLEFKAIKLGSSKLEFSLPYGADTFLLDPNINVIPNVTLIDGAARVVEHLPVHDVAVTGATPSATEIYVGETVNITVAVQNEGDLTETLVVTCKCEQEGGEYVIGTQIVTNLAPLANATLTFKWTPTDVSAYTIKAEVPSLAGETDIADNMLTSPVTIRVKMLGDINGDNMVDIRDLAQAARSFGSYPGHSKWDPQVDINHDNMVDIRDLVLIAKNFGKTYP